MAVMQQCPECHRRSSLEKHNPNKCVCGYDLATGRKNQKVRYYAVYRRPEGGRMKQVVEFAGYKRKEAVASDGKRRGQKWENRILEIQPEYDQTWGEIAEKFLALADVKKMPSYARIKNALERFLENFKNRETREFKPQDLIDFQEKALESYEPSTVHQDRLWVQKMVNWAADNDEIYPKVPRMFTKTKRVTNPKTSKAFKNGDNARDRVLSVEEYLKLLDNAPEHLQDILTVAYNTGMRSTEYFKLGWEMIDLKAGFIRLPPEIVKTRKARAVPINRNVREVLERLPRGLPGTPVFRYRCKSPEDFVNRALKTACENAGIVYGQKEKGGFCFRDVRASVKTGMLHAGVEETLRDALLGHSKKGMDVHYLRIKDEDLVDAMDRYTAWLEVEKEKVKKSVKISSNSGLETGASV